MKNDILMHNSQGKCVILLLLDLSAAFDTVDHSFLLNDLVNIGVSKNSIKWFESYLSNRKHW